VDFLIGILNILIVLGSLFLVCIILIQRGKGGGLAGAFGGVGGSSAFGTKAGDVFTRITIGVAIGWILTAMLLVVLTNRRAGSASTGWGSETTSASRALAPSKSKTTNPTSGAADKGLAPPSPATDTGAGGPPVPAPVDIPAVPDQPAKSGAPSPTPAKAAPKSP
jgi:preprotein translocase subunit SecG